MVQYISAFKGAEVLNGKVKQKYKQTKFIAKKVLVPTTVANIIPADAVILTYEMVASLLHIQRTTLNKKIYLKEIKSLGTKPGTILLTDYLDYVAELAKNRFEKKKKSNNFKLRVPSNQQYNYSEEEANLINQTTLRSPTTENNGEMKVQNI